MRIPPIQKSDLLLLNSGTPEQDVPRLLELLFPGQPLGAEVLDSSDLAGIPLQGGVYRAMSLEHVVALVKHARKSGRKLRVAGSGHSAKPAIFSADDEDIRVVLEGDLRSISLSRTQKGAEVRVGGGCYLGRNPEDPASTWANSLNAQLEAWGLALPILGGITHQTIAGFMQTSSSGGSLKFGFADAVKEIGLVDGTGTPRTIPAGSDEFYAAGVGLGLFGVITHVTLICEPRYFVEGAETNIQQNKSLLVKENGKYRLEEALANNDYLHLNWFAQKKVKRVMQWTGSRTDKMEPFKPYDSELRNEWMNRLAAIVLRIGNLLEIFDPNLPFNARLIGKLLEPFVPLDDPPKEFRDFWYRALPSDDAVDVDKAIPIQFTEIWLPVNQLTQTLDALIPAIDKEQRMAGNFAIELYGAKDSPFWMSPAYSRKEGAVRVDVFWWARNLGSRERFFAYYWDLLLELKGARLHWGKYLPVVGKKYGSITFGPEFIRQAYSERMGDWLKCRARFDPDGVFLTDYWRAILGI